VSSEIGVYHINAHGFPACKSSDYCAERSGRSAALPNHSSQIIWMHPNLEQVPATGLSNRNGGVVRIRNYSANQLLQRCG
jgi:hypothetical protein